MWSFDSLLTRARVMDLHSRQHKKSHYISILGCISACFLLYACGFEPLYGERDDSAISPAFGSIAVAPIEDRVGQQVRNRLLDLLTPKGTPDLPAYRLVVDLERGTTPLLIQLDNTATRFNLSLDAAFTLVEVSTGETVYGDHARSIASFNLTESEFATVAAERNAEDRAAREVSDHIALLLAVYFDRRG